jgi:hypothetical protein
MVDRQWHDAQRVCREALDSTLQDLRFESLLGCAVLGVSTYLRKDALPHPEAALALDLENLDARAGRARYGNVKAITLARWRTSTRS